MHIGSSTDIGKHREINQDSYFVSEEQELPLFIIADGMGGHKAGEVASKMAIDIIKEKILEKAKDIKLEENIIAEIIREAIESANVKVYEASKEKEECSGMGTTITMTYILDNKAFIGQVGDSRAYLLRDNELIQLTKDHSLVAELLRNGSITEEEAECHPQRNLITRAVGTDEGIDIDIVTEKLYEEDLILLCTDGLTNMVDDNEIKEVLLKRKDIKTACDELVNLANNNGGYDNITVVAVKIV